MTNSKLSSSFVRLFDQLYLFWEGHKQRFILFLVTLFLVTALLVFFLQRQEEVYALNQARARHLAEKVLTGSEIEKSLSDLQMLAGDNKKTASLYAGVLAQGELGLFGIAKAKPFIAEVVHGLADKNLVIWKRYLNFVEALESGESKRAEELSDALLQEVLLGEDVKASKDSYHLPELLFALRLGRASLFFEEHKLEKLNSEIVCLKEILGITNTSHSIPLLTPPSEYMGLIQDGAFSLLDLYSQHLLEQKVT
jgi:hypothetical protein